MIKLKQLLLENTAPDIFIPRRIEGRVERMIRLYVRNGSKGGLRLNRVGLTKLPDILNNIRIGGEFDCSGNNLTTLEGAPKIISEDFNCNDNYLTSLEFAPKSVGYSFQCGENLLTSLQGAPKSVSGFFLCSRNKLTTLEGGPVKVGVDFYCSYNNLTSLTGAPKSVGRDFYCGNNPVKFTREQVRAVCDVKGKIFV
jgi:hypothetical protein